MKISGKIFDVITGEVYRGELTIENGIISRIEKGTGTGTNFILPGLIDSHIHIESSMLTPSAFAFEAVRHGTVTVVSDPHEIANVLGIKGVEYMISDAEKTPLRFYFGAPSCVPATSFETSGAVLSHEDIKLLLERPEIKYLSEMMNFPGVIYGDNEVHRKIEAAKQLGKPVDGHAPGLSGEQLEKYVRAGISTDHECSTISEAREKISLGMKVLIREGSAARNLEALKELYKTSPEMVMLCSDDLHPEMLRERHINKVIARLIKEGYNPLDVIRSATVNPSEHYGLDSGLLRVGQKADFIVTDSLAEMNILETWIGGEKVYDRGKRSFEYAKGDPVNNFNCSELSSAELEVRGTGGSARIIEAYDGELLTGSFLLPTVKNEIIASDPSRDILKIVVKDRYRDAPPATGFIKGFGLKQGAFASSVAHDSHNIVAVGCNDEELNAAVNEVVRMKGGLAVSISGKMYSLQLDVAGIMTSRSCDEVAVIYSKLSTLVRNAGCSLSAPFMTLSFMALLVIPELKMSDRGLFDVNKFSLVPLFND